MQRLIKTNDAQYEVNLNDQGGFMGKSLRKIKREKEKITSPFHPEIMAAWNRGFEAGAKRQNELDTQLMMEWLGKLEEIPRIGEKTAWKIREHFLDFMKEKRERNESALEQNNTAADGYR